MALFFCQKCSHRMDLPALEENAPDPTCPVCKQALSYFGAEEGQVSLRRRRLESEDQDPSSSPPVSRKNFDLPSVDINRLATESALNAAPENVEALLHAGLYEYTQKNLEKAEVLLKKAITVDPTCAKAFQTLADLYLKSDRLTEASAVLIAFSQAEPENDLIFYNLGLIAIQQGAIASGVIYFKQALSVCKYPKMREKLMGLVDRYQTS